MKKKCTLLVSCFMSLALLTGSIMASADLSQYDSSDAMQVSQSIDERNQAILDKLVVEYNLEELGIDVWIRPTREDNQLSGTRNAEKSAEQYESDWREMIEMAIEQKEKVIAQYEKSGLKFEDIEWIESSTTARSTPPSRATKTVKQSSWQSATVGSVHLEATLMRTEDGTNITRYQSVQNAYGADVPWWGYGFAVNRYTYSYADSQRTCCVSYYGTLHIDTGALAWSEYAEFYAVW